LTDPRGSVMAVPQVAEEKRFCWKCAAAVGRTKGGRAGRTKGFCPNCGSSFDLDPRLAAGTRVGGQYEVVGCLAHGGFGWIYLAVDRNVSDRPVVLKGVLNQGDTEAVDAAIAEKRFLAELQHGNVVEIYNFVEHEGAGYIVMEFVGGRSLKQVLKDRMAANGGTADPLPVDVAIGYVLGILPALGYLHRQGYLYCDFKPDNVMHSGEDLKLIDLGGVRRIDDAHGAIYGTVGFQAPEIATAGPSVSSDVYTVVRTLAVLTLDLPGYQREFRESLPDAVAVPLFQRHESFYRLLLKGTAPNPDDRFQSVDELADQLLGVLREVVAVSSGQPRPAVSTRFTTDRWRPSSGAMLSSLDLPDLKPDESDPAASFLTELVGVDAARVVQEIDTEVAAGRVPDTPGVRLRRVQALVELADTGPARAMLADLRVADPWEWRVSWFEGLLLLAAGDGPGALAEFDRVRTDVPGELAPKLAAAMAAERSGDAAEAAALYALVAGVDGGFVTALFGLARCRAQLGDLDGAVAALHRVPASSAAQPAALEQEATWLLHRASVGGDLRDAASAAGVVQQAAVDGRRRATLAATVLQQVLGGFAAGRLRPEPGLEFFGEPGTEAGVRRALERTLRELARTEPDRTVRIGIVDQANAVRPRTWW
jgi:serine/threonine-protein kinase PknG